MIAHYRRTQHRVSLKSKFLGAFKYRSWWTTLRGTGGLVWQVWNILPPTGVSREGNGNVESVSQSVRRKKLIAQTEASLQNVISTLGT